jgi:hypothetical protein
VKSDLGRVARRQLTFSKEPDQLIPQMLQFG